MKPQYIHDLTTSLTLRMDNYLLDKAEAFVNKSGFMMPTGDSYSLGDEYYTYGSPYKQWVYDSSIEAATVASGFWPNIGDPSIYGNKFFELGTGNQSVASFKIDYDNGRVIFNSDVSGDWGKVGGEDGSNIVSKNETGIYMEYSVKEFNLYLTNSHEEQLIVDSNFDVNDRFNSSSETAPVAPYDQVLPAIFINPERNFNQPYAFGGEDLTTTNFRCVVMADDQYQLEGALSLFSDSKNEVFVKVFAEEHPFDEFGNLKHGTDSWNKSETTKGFNQFNYKKLKQSRPDDIFLIRDVTASKLDERVTKETKPNLFIGFLDFEVVKNRFPRL